MRNLSLLFLLSVTLFSCEKEDTKVADNSNTTNEPIVGKWIDWQQNVQHYDSLGNWTNHSRRMFGGSEMEFASPNTITHTVGSNFNASGNYSISGSKINLTLSNGVFNTGGAPINILSPNPYSGFIDTLNSKRMVFRDTVFHANGKFDVSVYSANKN